MPAMSVSANSIRRVILNSRSFDMKKSVGHRDCTDGVASGGKKAFGHARNRVWPVQHRFASTQPGFARNFRRREKLRPFRNEIIRAIILEESSAACALDQFRERGMPRLH